MTLILLNRRLSSDQSTKTLPYPIPSDTHMHTQNPLFKCANWILTNMEKSHCPRGPQTLFRSMVFLRESSHLCSGSPGVLWHLYLWTWVLQCHHPPPHPTSLGLGSDLFWPTGHRGRPECLQPALPQGCSLASRYGCTQDPSRPDAGPGLERCQVDSRNTAVYYSAKATWRAAHEPRLGFKISVQNIQRRGRNREP